MVKVRRSFQGFVVGLYLTAVLFMNCGIAKSQKNPLFVFYNGINSDTYNTPQKQVALLKELGYAGMEKSGFEGVDELLAELDRQGLDLFTIYANINLDPNQPHFDARLTEVLPKLKGRKTMLWLNVTSKSKTYPTSSSAGDTAALRLCGK